MEDEQAAKDELDEFKQTGRTGRRWYFFSYNMFVGCLYGVTSPNTMVILMLMDDLEHMRIIFHYFTTLDILLLVIASFN